MCQELQIFCSCIYVLGCKLSVVRLCDSDFGITPVDHITVGITCAVIIIIITIIILSEIRNYEVGLCHLVGCLFRVS